MNYRHLYWGAPMLLAGIALGVAAWAPLRTIDPEMREQAFVIPKGTWARRSAGEKLEVLPSEIRLTIGVRDILVLRNQDDVPQMFGPVLIMPGQSFKLPFREASSYQFACTAHVSGQLAVVVDPVPEAGWARLRWRTNAVLGGSNLL